MEEYRMLKESYLDLIPVIRNDHSWITDDEGRVVISTKRKGFAHKMGFKDSGKMKQEELALDEYGSIVWRKINGQKSIRDIAEEIVKELGEEREFAKKRAAMFFKMLKMQGLILYMN